MTTLAPELNLPPEHPLRQILDTIAAHPELREPVLRVLLSERLLALPEQVDTLTERVDTLQASFDDFREETRAQFTAVNERIDETNRQLSENTRATRRLEGHVGRLVGNSYEDLCRRFIGVILDGRFDSPVLADRERIDAQLRLARRNRIISREEYEDGLCPDIIARDEDDENQTGCLAVVEASISFNRRDLENAARRAGVIARVTGLATDAYVATHYPWPDAMDAAAEQLGVTIIQKESAYHADD